MAWLQEVSGRALLLGGNAGGAARELRRAVASLEPLGKQYQIQLATTLALLGDALAAAEQPADARLAWGRAVALFAPSARDSYNPLALDAWARSLIQLGRGEEARPALARLAAIGYQPARPFPRAGS
jgi:tetratricopeptide (TPR) repeat protein